MIQFRKPVTHLQERYCAEDVKLTVKDARLENGQVKYKAEADGRPGEITESEDMCLHALSVSGVTLTDVRLEPDGTLVYDAREL